MAGEPNSWAEVGVGFWVLPGCIWVAPAPYTPPQRPQGPQQTQHAEDAQDLGTTSGGHGHDDVHQGHQHEQPIQHVPAALQVRVLAPEQSQGYHLGEGWSCIGLAESPQDRVVWDRTEAGVGG